MALIENRPADMGLLSRARKGVPRVPKLPILVRGMNEPAVFCGSKAVFPQTGDWRETRPHKVGEQNPPTRPRQILLFAIAAPWLGRGHTKQFRISDPDPLSSEPAIPRRARR
jgi:hypothetical protein